MSKHVVLESLPDTKAYRNRKLVKSGNSGETYTVSIRNRDNIWACSCKGWIFTHSRKGNDCDHIREIKVTYGDKSRAQAILMKVNSFAGTLAGGIRDITVTLKTWAAIKDETEMLLLYLENEGKTVEAGALSATVLTVRGQLAAAMA